MTGAILTATAVAVSATTGQWAALIVVLAVTAVFVVWMVRAARRNRRP